MRQRSENRRVVIMGAAGRDFHNFNQVYRGDASARVVAFTATQIPAIANRRYPAALAGPAYPDGIPIVAQDELARLCRDEAVDEVVFAYSDVSHEDVMHMASVALAAGADFLLLGPAQTMIAASLPVIATSAVRTGCGKSQVTRWLSRLLTAHGLKAAVIRHPMPYGDLAKQAVQRFATREDLAMADCTIEEREEYEPHIAIGNVVYAGVDYARIVRQAQTEVDVLLWDGGNNDFPFIRPDLHIVLVDPLRPGAETSHHPGEAVLRMADIVVVAKSNSAADADIRRVSENAARVNPGAAIVRGASPVTLDTPAAVRGKRVLVIEDGPTITHGGMSYGAGYVAAMAAGAATVVDARAFAADSIAAVYAAYPHIGAVLPAMGYHRGQLRDLAETVKRTPADVVVTGTPCDLGALIQIDKPVVRARYEYADADTPGLEGLVERFITSRCPRAGR